MMSISFVFVGMIIAFFIYRYWYLSSDHIINDTNDPFLNFAETERRAGKHFFSAWKTDNQQLLQICKTDFPDIYLPDPNDLKKPDLTPVTIAPLSEANLKLNDYPTFDFIAVGGAPAAMAAFQKTKTTKRVLYVNQLDPTKNCRPISAGAANHIERDILTQAPAHITGIRPFYFVARELLRYLLPPRYDQAVLRDAYPWLTLNVDEWLRNPLECLSLCRVALNKSQLARGYHDVAVAENHTDVVADLRAHTNKSCDLLDEFNHQQKQILRDTRGALLVASDLSVWENLLKDKKIYEDNDAILRALDAKQVKEIYGFLPRNAVGFMEKPRDVVLAPQYMDTLIECIKASGADVNTNLRLRRIFVAEQGGIVEFITPGTTEKHYYGFHKLHLSLGSTLFKPSLYDLVSVTGVSINALVMGVNFTGGAMTCGGAGNHIAITPLLAPKMVDGEICSFIRIAVGGAVSPLNRSQKDWYTYSGRTAVNALHAIRKLLPEDAKLHVLSVTGCNRVIGRDGRMVEIHPTLNMQGKRTPIQDITIQVGAGGGGLTQMGASSHC